VVLHLERDRWRSVNSTTGIATMAHDRPRAEVLLEITGDGTRVKLARGWVERAA